MNKYLIRFKDEIGGGQRYSTPTEQLLQKYKDNFQGYRDKENHLAVLWKNHGFCVYGNGLFTTVNPDDYIGLAESFPDVSEGALVFARSAAGNLFIWEDLNIGKTMSFVNVHKGTTIPIATNFDIFFQFDVLTENYWKRCCYGKIELKLIDKFGPLAADECYSFVPALALGGSESIKKMQKVKFREQLGLLAQLYE